MAKHELKIKYVKRETSKSISVALDVPTHLSGEFDYEPGQYLTVEIDFKEGFERRAYSISSSTLLDDEISFTVKHLEGGKVSTFLVQNAKKGMSIKVFSPEGTFVPEMDENHVKHYILIAAGSGITPIMSILKSVLIFEQKSTVTLLYGNRDEESIIFKESLDELAKKFSERLQVVHTLSSPSQNYDGLKGRIDNSMIEKVLNKSKKDHGELLFFLCGPSPLIESTREFLVKKGIMTDQIRSEYFVKDKKGSSANEFIGKTRLNIILDNEQHDIVLENDSTILEAVINAGLDPPYSCKVGACSSCKAKLQKGLVKMDDDEILTEGEKEEGYILTCQAYANSDHLVISYDDV